METQQAAQPQHEDLKKSFDSLASIDMFRFDLQRFGQILPETREQVGNEELSYVTEGIDRASRTSFVLRNEGQNLLYFKEGRWQPYIGMLLTGLEVAKREAVEDPRKQFQVERAADDLRKGYQMMQLQAGQKLTWYSAYPDQEATRYGREFIASLGYKPQRAMGFIYQAERLADGRIILKSQTVDRSNEAGFVAAMTATEHDPEADLDTITRVYDGTLVKQYGGHFYAGRRQAEVNENIWNQVLEQQDLIGYYLHKLEQLAGQDISREQLEYQTKKERYGFWAALSARFENKTDAGSVQVVNYDSANLGQMIRLEHESRQALQSFVREGRMLIGCGGATLLQGEKDIMDANTEDVFSAIFGSDTSKGEAYNFDKKMHCVVCQAPPAPKAGKKWCGPCGICKLCDVKIQARNR
jgi:hypothetical protein